MQMSAWVRKPQGIPPSTLWAETVAIRSLLTRSHTTRAGVVPQVWLTPEPVSAPPGCITSPGQLWLRSKFLEEQVVGVLLCCLGWLSG